MKLVVYLTDSARVKQVDQDSVVTSIDLEQMSSWTEEQLELYGADWARFFKTDIVMIMRTHCHGDGEQHCCCDQLEDCEEEECEDAGKS